MEITVNYEYREDEMSKLIDVERLAAFVMTAEGNPDNAEVSVNFVTDLGDIVLAPDVAEHQAPEYGMTFADEVSLLIVHGLLHLCGYDHMEEDEALEMEARERELLTEFYGREFKRSGVEVS